MVEQLRVVVENGTLPDLATVTRTVMISDGGGGMVPDPVAGAAYTDRPCRLESSVVGASGEREAGERIQMITPWRITFAADTVIYASDVITVTSVTHGTRVFEVGNVLEPQSFSAEMAVLASENV